MRRAANTNNFMGAPGRYEMRPLESADAFFETPVASNLSCYPTAFVSQPSSFVIVRLKLRGEAHGAKSVMVKAVHHNKAGNVITPRQCDRGSQLVFKVLGDFPAVNPQLHTLGDAVQCVAGSLERKCLAYHLTVRGRRADVYSEPTSPGQRTIGSCVGVTQHISSAAGGDKYLGPGQGDVMAGIAIEIADKRERRAVFTRWNINGRFERSIPVAQQVGGKMSLHVAAGEKDVIPEVTVEIARGHKLIWDAGAGLDYVLVLHQQPAGGKTEREYFGLKVTAADEAAHQRRQALDTIAVKISNRERGDVA